ncbi:DNA methyltransferase [Nannocystis sp.]|uniref:DNA methyltransferase n=1 Tax=Nannocystis sp. TaxID=1962667 RepID=UPI0025CF00E3|nr:DNA methyltransferase [Nannocystis sp.]MBK7829519.1 class I SAM-dependent DNA methyltransferase [Nannocystis sp.]
MTLSNDLAEFVQWTDQHIEGDEKGEAQVFLDRLFKAFGLGGVHEAGGKLEARIRRKGKAISFADYMWKPVVLIEMKKRGEPLKKHQAQAFDYWIDAVPHRPRWVVLCNFDEFWVYDFDTQIHDPMDIVTLKDLPRRHGALAFLQPDNPAPTFKHDTEGVTRKAADLLAQCFNSLTHRGVARQTAQRFILQSLVALFSEDIGLLPKYTFSKVLNDITRVADSYDLIGGLFDAMNTRGITSGGRYRGVDYFNGGLFAAPARLELTMVEVGLLCDAAAKDWTQVRPEIFGSIFEHSMDREERHAFGAHFTSAADIMRIVRPTIIDPWREVIENATTQKRLDELRARLWSLRILDPACGSGNFLYVAYRELKRLESRLIERRAELSSKKATSQIQFGFVNAAQFYGLDIDPFAVELAKTTMMIARKLAIDELSLSEPALPLDNLDANFRAGDALIDSEGDPVEWPPADIIIGNPPFLGAKRLKPERGDAYIKQVRSAFKGVGGMTDYCVYWFRKAHAHLGLATAENPFTGRAGLVGTQNVRNGKSREGGLDYIVEHNGAIVDAADNLPWSGEAQVHVAIVNWVKTKDPALLPKTRRLWQYDDRSELESFTDVEQIYSSLSSDVDISQKQPLAVNKKPKQCYQGKVQGYEGFILTAAAAAAVPAASRPVVRPWSVGGDLINGKGIDRYVIDFRNMELLEASKYKWAFDHVKARVRQDVLAKAVAAKGTDMAEARKEHADRWWQLWNRRDELDARLDAMKRFVGCPRVGRRLIMVFVSTDIVPSDLVQVFAFADDYSFGILQSAAHREWWRKSSRMKIETDVRYGVREVFETFPWPQAPTERQVVAVAETAREVRAVREKLVKGSTDGIRELYRTLELGGKSALRDAHKALDAAVRQAYGFAPKFDLIARLLQLNREVAVRITKGLPVTAPGIPGDCQKTKGLISSDCIRVPGTSARQ